MNLPDFLAAEVEAALADLDPRSQVRGRAILERLAYRAERYGRDTALAELLTTEQMAARLGLSVGRVRVLARDRGVGWRITHDILFRPEDVARLENRRVGRPRKSPE